MGSSFFCNSLIKLKQVIPIQRLCIIGLLGILIAACEQKSQVSSSELAVKDFLQQHWPDNISAQGNPPATFNTGESSLDPKVCGGCHIAQFEQWRTSLHSHTMGSGINWQLQLMNQQEGNKCLHCHAPLAEQKALVALQRKWPNAPRTAIPDWIPADLSDQGLVCAACHVRRHQRFGPPPRSELTDTLPHAGFTASPAFQDSAFCAACHQHKLEDNPPRINGKLQVDTWQQWKQSPQAEQGIQCQSCHMPDRQHLWRGIHDPDMTASALDVQLDIKRETEQKAMVDILLTNKGAGHHFPTYMVPKVNLILTLINQTTNTSEEVYRYVIGWQVNIELTEEQFDSRIPAGKSRHLEVPLLLADEQSDWLLETKIIVEPREHYERSFRNSLKYEKQIPATVAATLHQAVEQAAAAQYTLLQQQRSVPPWQIAK